MKIYKPPQRLIDLGEVLQWDREKAKTFTVYERMSINQERSHLLKYDTEFEQPEALYKKIDATIKLMKLSKFLPENPIKYVRTYQ